MPLFRSETEAHAPVVTRRLRTGLRYINSKVKGRGTQWLRTELELSRLCSVRPVARPL